MYRGQLTDKERLQNWVNWASDLVNSDDNFVERYNEVATSLDQIRVSDQRLVLGLGQFKKRLIEISTSKLRGDEDYLRELVRNSVNVVIEEFCNSAGLRLPEAHPKGVGITQEYRVQSAGVGMTQEFFLSRIRQNGDAASGLTNAQNDSAAVEVYYAPNRSASYSVNSNPTNSALNFFQNFFQDKPISSGANGKSVEVSGMTFANAAICDSSLSLENLSVVDVSCIKDSKRLGQVAAAMDIFKISPVIYLRNGSLVLVSQPDLQGTSSEYSVVAHAWEVRGRKMKEGSAVKAENFLEGAWEVINAVTQSYQPQQIPQFLSQQLETLRQEVSSSKSRAVSSGSAPIIPTPSQQPHVAAYSSPPTRRIHGPEKTHSSPVRIIHDPKETHDSEYLASIGNNCTRPQVRTPDISAIPNDSSTVTATPQQAVVGGGWPQSPTNNEDNLNSGSPPHRVVSFKGQPFTSPEGSSATTSSNSSATPSPTPVPMMRRKSSVTMEKLWATFLPQGDGSRLETKEPPLTSRINKRNSVVEMMFKMVEEYEDVTFRSVKSSAVLKKGKWEADKEIPSQFFKHVKDFFIVADPSEGNSSQQVAQNGSSAKWTRVGDGDYSVNDIMEAAINNRLKAVPYLSVGDEEKKNLDYSEEKDTEAKKAANTSLYGFFKALDKGMLGAVHAGREKRFPSYQR